MNAKEIFKSMMETNSSKENLSSEKEYENMESSYKKFLEKSKELYGSIGYKQEYTGNYIGYNNNSFVLQPADKQSYKITKQEEIENNIVQYVVDTGDKRQTITLSKEAMEDIKNLHGISTTSFLNGFVHTTS